MTTNENEPRQLARVIAFADAAERMLVVSVYICLVGRLAIPVADTREITNLLLLTSEGLVVAFVLLRRAATQISLDWRIWVVALSATLAPLLVNASDGPSLAPHLVCASLLVTGMVIQIHAKLSLGRSFGCVPAYRGLKLSGPYRFVRHPMYAGYLLSHMAFLLMNPTIRNTVVYAATYALQIPRILAEERFLSSDPKYCEYQNTVRWRLIPGIY